MMRIRVEYDAYNRVFKLLDQEFGAALADSIVYEFAMPLAFDGADMDCESLSVSASSMAHA